MSIIGKTLFIFLLAFGILIYFPQTAIAAPTCKSMGITYDPDVFLPNPSDLTMTFTVNNANTARNLGQLRLHFIAPGAGGLGDINTNPTTVTLTDTGGKFSLNPVDIDKDSEGVGGVLRGGRIDALKSRGPHEAVLDSKTVGDFKELCTGITYFVTSEYACAIDPTLQTKVPPRTPFTVAFSGRPNTEYQLFMKPDTLVLALPLLASSPTYPKWHVARTTTKLDGQGVFNGVTAVNFDSGSSFQLSIAATDMFNARGIIDTFNICTKPMTIDVNAPTPNPNPPPVPAPGIGTGITSGPISTSSGTPKICSPTDLTCSLGGGTSCENDLKNPGISTAIGCIHTKPASFIKDLLKLAVGISGGIAFLMMLLGAFQMITSAGNPETLKAGQERLTSAIIGLLFVIFSVLLLQVIGADILNLPGFTK